MRIAALVCASVLAAAIPVYGQPPVAASDRDALIAALERLMTTGEPATSTMTTASCCWRR
jgi:hypothetical protein